MKFFALKLVTTISLLIWNLSAAASEVQCHALFTAMNFDFSSPALFGAPIPEPLLNRIHDQQKLDEIDYESFDQARYVESWGFLRTGRASYPAYQAMRTWTPENHRSIDLIVYKTHLKQLAGNPASKGHFSGDVKDIESTMKQLRLDMTEVQEQATFFRFGVFIKTEENFKQLQRALSYAAILPYAIAANSPFNRNLLMNMPESEKVKLAELYKKADGDTDYWGWANYSNLGRISFAALEKIAQWDGKSKITFQIFVMRAWLTYLGEKEPKTFTGTEADLVSLSNYVKLPPLSNIQISPTEIVADVTIESPEQLTKLNRLLTGAVIRPAITLKD